MRKLRIAVVLVFILSVIAFGAYNVVARMTADHTPPTITCDEDTISVSVQATDDDLRAGVTAEDKEDGDLTDSVRVASMSRFTEKGKRTIQYVVFDKANQSATLTRNLEYTDYVSPQIMLTQPLRVNLDEVNDMNLSSGMSVTDCLDGDISNKIRVSFDNNAYVEGAGTYKVTAQVSNSAGDTCVVPLELTVVDGEGDDERGKYYPMLSQYIVYTAVGQQISPMDYLTGFMRGDTEYTLGSLPAGVDPAGIVVGGVVDYNTPGAYTLEYSYSADGVTTAVTKLVVMVEE